MTLDIANELAGILRLMIGAGAFGIAGIWLLHRTRQQ